MVVLVVRGTAQLEALGRRLKAAGGGGLRRDLVSGIRDGGRPVIAAMKARASGTLPARGGLAAAVARSRINTSVRTTGDVGVSIRATSSEVNVANVDAGLVRHPVFGRGPRVVQTVPSGWFTDPARAAAPLVQKQIQTAMGQTARKIERG